MAIGGRDSNAPDELSEPASAHVTTERDLDTERDVRDVRDVRDGGDRGVMANAAKDAASTGRLTGATIADRYQIIGLSGRGGLGRVFRVKHTVLGKQFALKLMNAHLHDDPERRELFYREAKVASALMHPNIVSVVDFGEDEVAGAYMVMEYLAGESLAERLRHHRHGIPVKAFCEVMHQLAEALHYIHREGVVHGDIKSDNVICWRDHSASRRRWQIKLLDFGLAFQESEETMPSTVGGTPEYIAPERLDGSLPHPAADIYALGILGYELLTGRVPFEGNVNDILHQQICAQPPPIASQRGEAVDERVDSLIQRAIRKSPSERHPTMESFIYELRTVMDMLGMRRRRPGIRASMAPDRSQGHGERSGRAASAFDTAPFPMAVIDVTGAIAVANREFAKFLTGDRDAELGEDALLSSDFVAFYPKFLRHLRWVHVNGTKTKKEVVVGSTERSAETLTFLMAPARAKDLGDVHVTVIPGTITSGES